MVGNALYCIDIMTGVDYEWLRPRCAARLSVADARLHEKVCHANAQLWNNDGADVANAPQHTWTACLALGRLVIANVQLG